ncbi:hypothetical protein M407DRAFT_7276 [Tulasnella calospora MUT 4182]|uniref:Uncharacterized protein n=1 Tax=Tulasnella calospora MUT 4182 TaxID=1051891 RepID=A0A0C3QAW0_9AGAM|nr:hypothetical protein M407DRAFT_7276 [Tulasnella calospora MUT 4182]
MLTRVTTTPLPIPVERQAELINGVVQSSAGVKYARVAQIPSGNLSAKIEKDGPLGCSSVESHLKTARKKWCREECQERGRGDEEGLRLLQNPEAGDLTEAKSDTLIYRGTIPTVESFRILPRGTEDVNRRVPQGDDFQQHRGIVWWWKGMFGSTCEAAGFVPNLLQSGISNSDSSGVLPSTPEGNLYLTP